MRYLELVAATLGSRRTGCYLALALLCPQALRLLCPLPKQSSLLGGRAVWPPLSCEKAERPTVAGHWS